MATPRRFYDLRESEHFITTEWRYDRDQNGRKRVVTNARGYPIYQYVAEEG